MNRLELIQSQLRGRVNLFDTKRTMMLQSCYYVIDYDPQVSPHLSISAFLSFSFSIFQSDSSFVDQAAHEADRGPSSPLSHRLCTTPLLQASPILFQILYFYHFLLSPIMFQHIVNVDVERAIRL